MRAFRNQILAAPVLALVSTGALAQDVESDEAAIQARVDEWVAAWDAGDIASVAALYTEDAEYHDAFGDRHVGRAAIEAALSEANAGPYQGSKLELQTISLRFINPALAVSDTRWEMTGMPEADGAMAPSAGLATVVLVKQGEQWLLTAHVSRVPYTPLE